MSRPRFGYLRVLVMLKRESWPVGKKRVYQLYRLERLQLRMKVKRRKRIALLRGQVVPPTGPNQHWSMDFVPHDVRSSRKTDSLAGRLQPSSATRIARPPDPERVRQNAVRQTYRSGQTLVQNRPTSGETSGSVPRRRCSPSSSKTERSIADNARCSCRMMVTLACVTVCLSQ